MSFLLKLLHVLGSPVLSKKKRVLVATDVRFWVHDRGSALRIRGVFEALSAQGFEIHVVHTETAYPDDLQEITKNHVSSFTTIFDDPTSTKINNIFRGKKVNYQNSTGSHEKLDRATKERMLKETFRALYGQIMPAFILVEYARMAFVLDELGHNCITVVDTHDVFHLMAESFEAWGESVYYRFTREEETGLLEKFDVIVAIQDNDAEIFRDLVPRKRVVTCYPSLEIIRVPASTSRKTLGFSILFVGGASRPNICGLENFLSISWPIIIAARPDVNLIICGSVCDAFKDKSFANVELLGHVEDLRTIYSEVEIVISPIFFGGGLKIKCAEAFAHGKACVMSRHSSLGMEDGAGSVFWVAETIEDFAGHILRLINTQGAIDELGLAARNYAVMRFSPAATIAPLISAVTELSR